MSKTEMKLAAAVESLVRVVKQAGVMSVAVDIGTFRTMFGLTNMGRKAISRAIDDVLTTNGIVEQFGPWVLAEIEHPMYQLSMLTANRVVFDDGPKPGLVECFVQAGLGSKPIGDDEEDDVANAKALDAADAERKAEDADKDADWATFIESVEYTNLIQACFNPTEVKILFDKGLVGGEDGEEELLSIEQLRKQLVFIEKMNKGEMALEARKLQAAAKKKPAKKTSKRMNVKGAFKVKAVKK